MPSVQTRHPGVARFVFGIALAVSLLSVRPALALCVNVPFVPGPALWLQAQENAGGHTIANHVGWTDLQLVARYNANPHIAGASTYLNNVAATTNIQIALTAQQAAYNLWEPVANNNATHALTTNMGFTVGRGVHTPTPRPAIAGDVFNQTRLITVMRKTGPGVCFLLTSYPTP